MKKFKWLLGILLLALVPMLQSCDDDDDYYSIGDFSWDWATVRTTGGGGYFLEGDRWGIIDPVSSSIPWYRPVDGERVVADRIWNFHKFSQELPALPPEKDVLPLPIPGRLYWESGNPY